jgi:hypothetical protein
MSLIPCTGDCVYQKDGCCMLERAATKGKPEKAADSCVHYVKKQSRQSS